MSVQGHRTWIELDRSAVESNTKQMKQLLNQGVAYCAVVKANAYGHDLEKMVSLLVEQGIQCFGVDNIDEALQVRAIAQQAEILILGYTIDERLSDVVRIDAIQTVVNENQLKGLNGAALKLQKTARMSLKIETGTMRQGVFPRRLQRFLISIKQCAHIELASVHSHFCDSESQKGESFTFEQYNRFADEFAKMKEFGFTPQYVHISSSAASTIFPELQGNMVRFGIMNYGLWPSADVKRRNQISPRGIELTPVLSWRTRIIQVKDVPPGTTISYGRTFVSDRPMRIAVLPVGYYDGYHRDMRDRAEVLIHGQRCRVLGTICMNMMIVDVSQLPQAKRDDIATLIGQDGMHRITAEDLAEWQSTINYEVVANLSSHLPRIIV